MPLNLSLCTRPIGIDGLQGTDVPISLTRQIPPRGADGHGVVGCGPEVRVDQKSCKEIDGDKTICPGTFTSACASTSSGCRHPYPRAGAISAPTFGAALGRTSSSGPRLNIFPHTDIREAKFSISLPKPITMNSDNAHTSDPMWSEPLPASYSSLTETEASFFLHHGWLRVPNAINPEYIDKWMADFWDRTGYDPNDKSTWKQEYLFMPHHRQVRIEEFCPEAWKKIVDIAGGEDRIDPDRERWIGDNFIVNFGSEARSKGHKCTDPATRAGWHADNDWYRQFLDSAGTAMTVVHCFTDIPPDGGGTWLCEDGIEGEWVRSFADDPGVVKTLYDHPEGLDPAVNCDIMFTHMPKCKRFTPLVANKGDTFILHGLLPHVAGYNHLHYARVITNPHITLKTEYNLNRPAKDYVSPCVDPSNLAESLGTSHTPRSGKVICPRVQAHPRAQVLVSSKL